MMKRFFILVFICCGLTLSESAKGVTVEELAEKADAAAQSAYAKINANWNYPETNEILASVPTPWKVTQVILNDKRHVYLASWSPRMEKDLEGALEKLFENKTCLLDCANAARLVRIYMICKMLGKNKTRALIARIHNENPENGLNFISALSWQFLEKVDNDTASGVYCLPFVNINEYIYFKPNGFTVNHNVVRLINNKYMGFEPSFFDSPKDKGELETFLYESFKKTDDVDEGKEEEHQAYCETLETDSNRFKEQREIAQRELGGSFKFNMQRLKDFIEGKRLH